MDMSLVSKLLKTFQDIYWAIQAQLTIYKSLENASYLIMLRPEAE